MPVEMLEHYTIRCASLERTRDFYRDIIGLTVGDRPNFPFKGYWLYLGGVPIVHLVDAAESEMRDGAHGKGDTAALDHIAFRGLDLAATSDLASYRAVPSSAGNFVTSEQAARASSDLYTVARLMLGTVRRTA